ncbi:MAG TPA: rRNA maturation RNase YbeY [Chitinophagaceae bacterium]|nr:rRNA maturation RNase YbeY [Chitinophagaceae bacterium]
MPVNFHFQDVDSELSNSKALEAYIIQLFNNEGIKAQNIDYIFCTDDFLLSLNKKYLNHDTYTDILTFDLSEKPKEMIAEIYISVERVSENANLFKKSFENELHRVIFHGALHLCGYDDHSEADKKEMRAQENKHLLNYLDKKEN